MAELGVGVAEKLIEKLGSEMIKEVCDMWGYKSQLEDLKETVSTIKKIFTDAEAKRELSNEEWNYIEKLKDVVYDADDLFDEFLTLAELKQLRPLKKGGKFFGKVRCFFSSKNQVGQAYRMSRQVKDIKKRLDTIADNHRKFGFNVDYIPISRRREESCSYVDANDIIGREVDKKAIIDMLLDASVSEDFRFLTIVGVGGLGKTALAQLVYNDEKVRNEFPVLRLWVCVSDQDGEQFSVKAILCKILELVTHQKYSVASTMEWVQNQFQEQFRGRKYLLVLDDVWNEDRKKWLELEKFLKLGQEGSRIVVTTRSEMTATIIGGKHVYKLEGLSEESSWHLFEITAFSKEDDDVDHLELVEVGKKIVEKCYGIPLAIKVVGSLLYGQDISKWHSFEESGLAKIGKGDNEIMSILKLSYHNLESSLKSCFSYCAVFPKDVQLSKEMLINLWMAQGYIVPLDGCQRLEEAGEEHFLILLRRCFFQDVEKDEYGQVKSVKIHDLIHDVAQGVGGEEICVVNSMTNIGDKTRHVSFLDEECSGSSLYSTKLRSFIHPLEYGNFVVTQVDKWTCLRVLELPRLGIESSLDSIGKLLHLRYLNLSDNQLEALPDSITRLYNLQTLNLSYCRNLRELPKDFRKLVKLRHLDLSMCDGLTEIPSDMDKLTSIRILPFFVTGKRERSSLEKQCHDELSVLKAFTNLKGNLHIKIGENYRNVEDSNGGKYLQSTRHVREVFIDYDKGCVNPEVVIEKLEPHSNLKGFILWNYMGTKIPSWGRAEDNWAISFPHLVKIELKYCEKLEQMPSLSKLPYLRSLILLHLNKLEKMPSLSESPHLESITLEHLDKLEEMPLLSGLPCLKYLTLRHLDKLEYMEDISNNTTSELATFFPSLNRLEIGFLEQLKGWRRMEGLVFNNHDNILRSRLKFHCLFSLQIASCPNLTSFPSCPSLDNLSLRGNHDTLQIRNYGNSQAHVDFRLNNVVVDNADYLKSISLSSVTTLCIEFDKKVENLSEFGELFQSCATSLRSLKIANCSSLKTLCGSRGGLEHLTV